MLETAHIARSNVHDAFLDANGLSRLEAADARVPVPERLSVMFPGEHCTECAAPDCHSTCDLFERGCTGRCKRFADGIVLMPSGVDWTPYVVEVLFKPWGQLFCVGNAACVEVPRFRRITTRMALAGRVFMGMQAMFGLLPHAVQWALADRIRGLGNRIPRSFNKKGTGQAKAEELLCVVGNPQPKPVETEISVSGFGDSQGGRSFRRTVSLSPGWNTVVVPVGELERVIDVSKLFRVCLVPLIEEPRLLQILYFGFAAGGTAASGDRTVKLAVFDLDNTLWDGVLVESPDETRVLRPGVLETLNELDRRGILLSIVSKNNPADARRELEQLGLWDLFLYPQVSWEPKSLGIEKIVQALNIGMNTVAFIDDSAFERAEVAAALPDVRTYEALDISSLASLPAFDVPVTEDSRRRREMYRDEQDRREDFKGSELDYDAFLRSCDMRLELEDLSEANRERVYELVQRTNQLNFSGKHYSREELDRVLAGAAVTPLVMRCRDRFGAYGIVGFAIVMQHGRRIEVMDLMFSCRIQGKKVEHSFFAYLAAQAAAQGLDGIACRLTRTERNAPAARVLADLPFVQVPSSGEGELHVLEEIPDGLPVRVHAPSTLSLGGPHD